MMVTKASAMARTQVVVARAASAMAATSGGGGARFRRCLCKERCVWYLLCCVLCVWLM